MNKRNITSKEKAFAVIKAYNNDKDWEQKVKKMSPWQIYAIYDSLVKRGIIYYDDKLNICYRTPEEVKELKKRREEFRSDCHQVTLNEYFGEKMSKEIKGEKHG